MTNIRNALMQAAGSASGDKVYVEDVFSTHLYDGTSGTSLAINNGIDLAGEGGLVWIKERSSGGGGNILFSTDASGNHSGLLVSNGTGSAGTGYQPTYFTQNNNGFTTTNTVGDSKTNGNEYASWSFRVQEGFFDIVTWTGNATGSRAISHALNAKVGMILVKCTSHTQNWAVYHSGVPTGYGYLNTSAAFASGSGNGVFGDSSYNNIAPTTSVFYVGTDNEVNGSGKTYVAYVFAEGTDSASQIFGDDGDEAIIKTGSLTTDGNGDAEVTLGFEPQLLLVKATTRTSNWEVADNMRGLPATMPTYATSLQTSLLYWNTNGAEGSSKGRITIKSNKFNVMQSASHTYIYMAIRRGPMKEPSAGTDVYNAVTFTGTGSAADIDSGFPVDLAIPQKRGATQYYNFRDRLRGNKQTLQLPLTSAQYSNASVTCEFDDMNGFHHAGINIDTGYAANGQSSIAYMFRRYPKVFDVIFYKGTNGGGASSSYVDTYSHNLGVKPEMMILKAVDNTAYALNWQGFHPTALLGSMCNLQDDSAAANGLGDTTADGVRFRDHSTASVIGRTNSSHTNSSSHSYVGYLFASLSGISAVNKYTGTGNDINVTDLGAAARFVLIKRVDSSGDWYVYDSARGIVAGNDIYSLFNSTSVEVTNTDYIDPHSSGFTITSSAPDALNASGGTYLYLAFA